MDTKALRQKVLDLAIRGKLVPQDPNDEPASVLLERIRQQKQQMVKDGKLKAKDIKNDTIIFVGEDNLHYEKFADSSVKCIEDEIPFELPVGWAWARLGTISEAIGDGDHQPPPQTFSGIPFLVISNVSGGKLSFENTRFVSAEYFNQLPEARKPQKGDLLFTVTGSYGIPILVDTDDNFCFQRHIAIVRPCITSNRYLHVILGSSYVKSVCDDKATGTAQKTVGLATLRELLIPVAPYNEQVRIYTQVRAAMSIVNSISSEKEDLLIIIENTKSKILNLAIRGQLVPQDPADEPASVLLEHIRAEKEELIKQGKLKRDKKESVIFRGEDNSYYEKIGYEIHCINEEMPFEIPDTWEWMRLENCCIKEIRRGKSPKYIEQSGTLVFAQKCNTKYAGIDIGLALYLDENTLGKYTDDEYMQDGDVVINSTGTGTLGRVGFYRVADNRANLPIVPDSHVTVVRAHRNVHAFYLYAFMKANQAELEKEGEGSTNQKELKPLTLKEILIPIPPFSEQKRIALAITAAFSTISAIEKNLT